MEQINQIICGNCLDIMRGVPPEAFIISDPPYNQKYHYDNYADNLKSEEYKNLLLKIFGGRKSVVIHYPEETINILSALGGGIQQVVSWVYNSNTAKQSRLITWWNCKPDFRAIPQPYKNPTDKRIKQRIAEGKTCRGYDWWEINQVKNVSKGPGAHSCPIPEEVARRIILSTTKPGDLVVDPFAGSGTICKVARDLGRRYIGIELSEAYCKIARERLAE